MRRVQLVEIEDLSWCPKAVRDGGTDWLRFMADSSGAFNHIAPKIRAAMDAVGTHRIVDLCSGGGGPWLTLQRTLANTGAVDVYLTDLFPNRGALEAICRLSEDRLHLRSEPVDATDVPAELDGVRTLFNSFHHFAPPLAREILADAVRKRRAIAVFEGVDSRLLGLLGVWVQPLLVALFTPWVRPVRLSRFALTYVLPLIPLLVLFDGTVSMFRIYSPPELRELVESIEGHDGFAWDIGTTSIPWSPIGLTHLVGTPRD